MNELPAARVTDRFGHDASMEGLIAGVAIGAAIAVGVVATGGLGAIAVGAALATTGAAGLAGAAIGKMFDGPDTGQLEVGSRNVKVNGLQATMVTLATGHCSHHGPSPRLVASGSATVKINGQPAARVTDTMDCGAVIRIGSRNVNIGGPTQSPVCSALRLDEANLELLRIDAQASQAAYDPPETRKAPDGYHNATPEELAKLRLSQDRLEHPIDPDTGEPSEFRAAVFTNDKTGCPIIAYKGTTSAADWGVNAEQGLDLETFYYDQAQQIAQRAASSPGGGCARLTGHSLGGGMSSAGAVASGLPATTFNAAGLAAHTVPHPVSADIQAVYVKGEPLRASQSLASWIPKSAATRTLPLAPADYAAQKKIADAFHHGPIAGGAALANRTIGLHLMPAVIAALAQKRAGVERALVVNGCP